VLDPKQSDNVNYNETLSMHMMAEHLFLPVFIAHTNIVCSI